MFSRRGVHGGAGGGASVLWWGQSPRDATQRCGRRWGQSPRGATGVRGKLGGCRSSRDHVMRVAGECCVRRRRGRSPRGKRRTWLAVRQWRRRQGRNGTACGEGHVMLGRRRVAEAGRECGQEPRRKRIGCASGGGGRLRVGRQAKGRRAGRQAGRRCNGRHGSTLDLFPTCVSSHCTWARKRLGARARPACPPSAMGSV